MSQPIQNTLLSLDSREAMRVSLHKFEVAERQLATGIRLLLSGGCLVSATTLIGASGEVLANLVKYHGGMPELDVLAKLSKAPDWSPLTLKKKHTLVQNFFKHADNDPEGVLAYDAGLTLDYAQSLYMLQFWCCMTLKRKPLLELCALSWWYSFHVYEDADWEGAPLMVHDLRAYLRSKPLSGRGLFWAALCRADERGVPGAPILSDSLLQEYERGALPEDALPWPKNPVIYTEGAPRICSESLKFKRRVSLLVP